MGGRKNIVEIATADESFSTLVTALKAAGLVDVLTGPGPYTVFAPTDAAFAKLPAGTVENLLQNEDQLTNVLKYHVVSGRIDARKLSRMNEVETLSGQKLTIKKAPDGTLMVNDSRVVSADIEATNGVIHVIDSVLVPR